MIYCDLCGYVFKSCNCAESIKDIDIWADRELGDAERGLLADDAERVRRMAQLESRGAVTRAYMIHPREDLPAQEPVCLEDLEDWMDKHA